MNLLFVCMGNICRSPSAQGIMRHLLERRTAQSLLPLPVTVQSAGTRLYALDADSAPDLRSQRHALRRGVDISDLRSKSVGTLQLDQFDYILAMDKSNLKDLYLQVPKVLHHRIHLMMAFATQHQTQEVPDPYYGDDRGFDLVLDYLFDACQGLLQQVEQAFCPLCAQRNNCALQAKQMVTHASTCGNDEASCAASESPCWCFDKVFDKKVLNQVAQTVSNPRCLCSSCAQLKQD